MKEVLLQLGGVDSIRAVQIGYEVIRVTFTSPAAFRQAKSMEGVHLFGFWCPILGGGPQPTMIHVFDFPFEGPDAAVEVALKAFGSVRGTRKQTYVGNRAVFTGTRLVSLVIERAVPRFLQIDGYRCRIWYNGQPLVCNLCAQSGHKSADCPNKDKCRKCGQSGHFARQCANAWPIVGAGASASPLPEETFPSLPSVSIPPPPENVPLPRSSSSSLSSDGDSSTDGSCSESSDAGSASFQEVLESEHIDRELASVVASAPVVDAPGLGAEVPPEDADSSDFDSVSSMNASSAGEDHSLVASVGDSITAAGASLKRKHCSGSSDDDDRVTRRVAGVSSCEPVSDSVGDPCTLPGEPFSEPSVVVSPLGAPVSGVDQRSEVTPALGPDLPDPPPPLAGPLLREPAALDDVTPL